MFGLPDGQRQVIIQGQQRFEIKEFIQTDPFLVARVSMIEEGVPHTKDFDARVLHLRQEALKALSLLPAPLQELRPTIERIENPLVLIDTIASILDLPVQEKQELLAILDPVIRAQKVSEKLSAQIELLELSKKIGEETKEAMDKTQREYFLREQLKAIQKELGEESGQSVEAGELRKKIADAKMPPEVEKEALRELSRFERMPEMAAEHSTIRTYSRLDDRAAMERFERRADRFAASAQDPRRGSLRSRQGEEANHRISRGAQVETRGQEPDTVFRRTSWRRAKLLSAKVSLGR